MLSGARHSAAVKIDAVGAGYVCEIKQTRSSDGHAHQTAHVGVCPMSYRIDTLPARLNKHVSCNDNDRDREDDIKRASLLRETT